LGKQPSDTQKALLEYFEHIFVMLDSDATDMAYEIAQDLVDEAPFRVTVVSLEKGDPDEYETTELAEKIVRVGYGRYDLPENLEVLAARGF
jgi:hypothetical protein